MVITPLDFKKIKKIKDIRKIKKIKEIKNIKETLQENQEYPENQRISRISRISLIFLKNFYIFSWFFLIFLKGILSFLYFLEMGRGDYRGGLLVTRWLTESLAYQPWQSIMVSHRAVDQFNGWDSSINMSHADQHMDLDICHGKNIFKVLLSFIWCR